LHGMMCHSLVLTSRIQFRKANIRSTPLLHLVDQPAPEFDVRLTAMSVTHRDHDELVYCAARGWESEENFLDMDFCFSLQSTKKNRAVAVEWISGQSPPSALLRKLFCTADCWTCRVRKSWQPCAGPLSCPQSFVTTRRGFEYQKYPCSDLLAHAPAHY
jgi:hypothetical protein